MRQIKLFLFSICVAAFYCASTLWAIGINAAGGVFWWFTPTDNYHFYHIAGNFITIGIAALIPAYLVYSYERERLWWSLAIMICGSMLFQGNVNHFTLDSMGLIRFIQQTLFIGDIGAIGVFLEILLLPFAWVWVFQIKIIKKQDLTESEDSQATLTS